MEHRYVRRGSAIIEIEGERDSESSLYQLATGVYRRQIDDVSVQLARMPPQGFDTLRRLSDGPEIDVSAAIDSRVQLAASGIADEDIYQKSVPKRRDVAVVLLLDLSSSTAEPIEDSHAGSRDKTVENSGSRLLEAHGRKYRRIIDVEKESVIVLTEALAPLGDALGVYGFSGTGRYGSRFVVVKDLDEHRSAAVRERVGALQPLSATRMGVAIRHAKARMSHHDAATKLLIVISDGRPRDEDYGGQYGDAELEYAIRDTRAAIDEAQRAGIRPLLLTVDRQGNDYLRTLCADIDYEIVSRTEELPTRLLHLYRDLSR